MSRRVLILSASVGAGHLRAAQAVELACRTIEPNADVRNVDVLDHATSAFRSVYSKAYLDLVNKAPHLLSWFYDWTDKPPSPKSRRDRLRMLVQRMNLRGFNQLLFEREAASVAWDVVICTHFLPAELISRLRRKKKWPDAAPVHTVVTDFDAHGLWVNTPLGPRDRFFVATEEAAITLCRWGVERERTLITGIPIHPRFAERHDQLECRRKHGLSPDRPVILLLAGGFGVGPIEKLFEAALSVKIAARQTARHGVHICVVCGRNEKLKSTLEKINPPAPHKAMIMGFTREIDELMAAADVVISKPGGLTTSEILASGAAMMIVNPIPGQEDRNSDFLLENGAAIKVNSIAVLPHKLERLLGDEARLRSLRNASKSLGKPRAAFEIAEQALCGKTEWNHE